MSSYTEDCSHQLGYTWRPIPNIIPSKKLPRSFLLEIPLLRNLVTVMNHITQITTLYISFCFGRNIGFMSQLNNCERKSEKD